MDRICLYQDKKLRWSLWSQCQTCFVDSFPANNEIRSRGWPDRIEYDLNPSRKHKAHRICLSHSQDTLHFLPVNLYTAARRCWPSPAAPASHPDAAAPVPHPGLFPSPPPHPRAPTLRILANPSNGLGGRRHRVEYDGARAWHRVAWLASGWDLPLVYIVNLVEGHAWPSPAASKVDAACELRHPAVRCSAGVFAGLHCGSEATDTAVCAPPLSPTADAPLLQDHIARQGGHGCGHERRISRPGWARPRHAGPRAEASQPTPQFSETSSASRSIFSHAFALIGSLLATQSHTETVPM
jgi:hypothetical protein